MDCTTRLAAVSSGHTNGDLTVLLKRSPKMACRHLAAEQSHLKPGSLGLRGLSAAGSSVLRCRFLSSCARSSSASRSAASSSRTLSNNTSRTVP